jgi:hypothetical protein
VAGYSGTPLAKKLGIRSGARVALVREPAGFEAALEPMPDGARLRHQARGQQDVVLFFATRLAELERRFDPLARAICSAGGLWIAWPKKTAGVATNLRENLVRRRARADPSTTRCAVDDTWSGLRFVYRPTGPVQRRGQCARALRLRGSCIEAAHCRGRTAPALGRACAATERGPVVGWTVARTTRSRIDRPSGQPHGQPLAQALALPGVLDGHRDLGRMGAGSAS